MAAQPGLRLLAGVTGTGGSGKSALLDQLEARYRASNRQVLRQPGEVVRSRDDDSAVLLVDDAHQLDDAALGGIAELVDASHVDLIVAYRPWPQPAGLRLLTTAIERHRPPVVLGPVPREEIAAGVESLLGLTPDAAFVDSIAEATAGMRWLVSRVLPAVSAEGGRATLTVGRDVMDQLGYELDALDPELRNFLLALAVGFDLTSSPPTPALSGNGRDLDLLVAEARSAGLLRADGRPVPLVQDALIATAPVHRVRALQRSLVDGYMADLRPLDDIARRLARGGYRDARVADTLERAADNALTAEPAVASELYEAAGAAGSDELGTAARRAQAAVTVGDLDSAGRILDDLLSRDDAPDLARAVNASASVWAQRGMLARAADIYRWFGSDRVGAFSPLAVVALVGVGDREAAAALIEEQPGHRSPTLLAVSASLLGDGIMKSVSDSPGQALTDLVRASDMLTASGAVVPMPDYPAALAAIVALHSAELDVAESVLDSALKGCQGGPAARPRLLLLKAWTAMMADRTHEALAIIAEVTAGEHRLVPRDEMLLRALEVGLARRSDDLVQLVFAWQRAREALLHVPVDLFSLLPLGELVVAAARVRDSSWLHRHLDEAWTMLGRLGEPPLWSTLLHWCEVQAAILADGPHHLAPHAAALVRAAHDNALAAALAAAARSWVSVLSGDFDAVSVEAAARGLAAAGLPWDASRLAGHAAARSTDRKDMTRLLACARELHSTEQGSGPAAAPVARRDSTGLSAREREVAALVLEGRTYREIGDAIFVSPRTAEHHIAQIKRRLGATSRSELLTRLRAILGPGAPGPGGSDS